MNLTPAPIGRRRPAGDEATITLRRPIRIPADEYSKEGTFNALTAAFRLDSRIKILLQWASGKLTRRPPSLLIRQETDVFTSAVAALFYHPKEYMPEY